MCSTDRGMLLATKRCLRIRIFGARACSDILHGHTEPSWEFTQRQRFNSSTRLQSFSIFLSRPSNSYWGILFSIPQMSLRITISQHIFQTFLSGFIFQQKCLGSMFSSSFIPSGNNIISVMGVNHTMTSAMIPNLIIISSGKIFPAHNLMAFGGGPGGAVGGNIKTDPLAVGKDMFW